MGKATITGTVTLEMIERFPDLPTNTIARKLFIEYPEVFITIESARSRVNYYRGTAGTKDRKKIKMDGPPEPGKFANSMGIPNPFFLPETDEAEWLPYDIPKAVTRLLILSDVHIPYHNIEAVTLALQYGKEKKVNGIMLNGDILDFYGLSSFEKDPRKRRFSEELEMGRQFLRILRKEFDGVPIYFKLGNHCERYERYLRIKAPELLDVSEFRLDVLLKFGELGVELIDSMRIVHFGKLNIMHGHEFGRSVFSPVNPARGLFTRAKESCIIGHHHQTSSHAEPSLNGDVINTWSQGCLCHDDKTEVLTDNGFVMFKDLKDTDLVLEYNMHTEESEYRKPIARQVLDYNGIMYSFKSRRVNQVVTPEHKMLANRTDSGNLVMSAKELFDRKKNLNIIVSSKFKTDETLSDKDNLYGELIGFIITDGSYRKDNGGIRIYQKNKFNRVKYLLDCFDVKYTISMSRNIPCFNIPSSWSKRIRELNPIKDQISRTLLNCNVNFLRGLYEGLIGGDGHRKKGCNTDYFSTHHVECTSQFQELCSKIGYSCLIQKFEGYGNNLTDKYWFMYKCFVRKFDMCLIKEKEEVLYSGKVYDITTTSGFFFIRREGVVSVSGNCELHPGYMPINKWNLGFAYVEREPDGQFTVHNHTIIKGKVR